MSSGIPAYAQTQVPVLTREELSAMGAARFALTRAEEALNTGGSMAWFIMDLEAASEDLAVVARAIRARVGMVKP